MFYLCKVQEQAEANYDDRSQKNGDFWRWRKWLEGVKKFY